MNSNWTLAASVFGVVFVAQLSGKSAMAGLVLATRYRPWPVFLGSSAALATHSAMAVAAGGLLSMLPARPVHVCAGILFLAAALLLIKPQPGDADEAVVSKHAAPFANAFGTAAGLVFAAEWGDLTQLATAALAARYTKPLPVFVGAASALCAVGAIAAFAGHGARHVLKPSQVRRVSAVVFACLGAALLGGLA